MKERRLRKPKESYTTRGPYLTLSTKERFEKYFVVSGERKCWIWQGAKDPRGYGRFNFYGKTRNAYAVAYEFYMGKVPKGLELDHLCRNPSCVNPKHLEPVTHTENYRRGDCGKHLGAIHRAKTHCPKGHTYNKENTAFQLTRGIRQRLCKTCQKIWWKKARLRKKQKG